MKFNLTTLFLLILSTALSAQTSISGTVLDADNKPIEFANIALLNETTQQVITGTISDKNGFFQLQTLEKRALQIRIQFLGYIDKTLPISNNKTNDLGMIVLSSLDNDLSEITVTANRLVIERIEDKLVFNISSSRLKSNYDGLEILSRAPSIWVDSEGNITTQYGRPQIFINGRQLNLSGGSLTAYLQNLQSDNIKSIEIQTNPSASADANNLGGIVNIVLKKKPTGITGNLRTSYEITGKGYYEFSSNANFNYGAEFWNLYGSYNHSRGDIAFATTTDIFYSETDNYLKTDIAQVYAPKRHGYQLGLVLSPWKNHDIGAEYYGRDNERMVKNNGQISLTNFADTLDYGIIDTRNEESSKVHSFAANYTWRIDTLGSTFKMVGDYTTQENTAQNDLISLYELGELTNTTDRNYFDNQTDLFSLQADFLKKFRNGFKSELGVRITDIERKNKLLAEDLLNNEWVENDRTAQLNYRERVSATYLTGSKTVAKNHFLKLGVRVENTDLMRVDALVLDTVAQNYTDWFPSAFYQYKFENQASFSASYSRRLRRPSFQELNNTVTKINDFRYFIGNPDLRPEYIDKYEISFQKSKHNFSLYYSIYHDAINGVYTLEDGIAYYQRKNAGNQTQYGISYSSTFDLTDWWVLRANTRLYHRKFTTETGEDIFERTTFDIRFSANLKINETTGIDITGRYLSPTYDAFYQQDPYYYLEFFVKKSFFKKKLNCRVYFNDPLNIFKTGNVRPFDDITTSISRKPRSRSITFWVSYNITSKNKVSSKKNSTDRAARGRI